jgi:hypothetical protein
LLERCTSAMQTTSPTTARTNPDRKQIRKAFLLYLIAYGIQIGAF